MALGACSKSKTITAPSSLGGEARRWDPKKTYAVISGVLSWDDPTLVSFSKTERKDQELYELLGARGVPADQRKLLLDEKATTKAVLAAVDDLVARAEKGSTFIFYYAGHGTKTDGNHIVFATTDIDTKNLAKTGLHVDDLAPRLSKLQGARVLLLADCCYSGGLADVAKKIAATGSDGREALAITSAEASNTSTVNWTYTQTVIDALSGRSLLDLDADGTITLDELSSEVKLALKCREGQRSGFASYGVPSSLILAETKSCTGCGKSEPKTPHARGSYVSVKRDGAWVPARVNTVDAKGMLSVAFYDYSHETVVSVAKADAKALEFPTHAVGTSLDVVWGGKTWEAKVLAVDDGFEYITYPGWPSNWDEWITSKRVVGLHVAGTPKPQVKVVKVLWGGRWWDAIVTEKKTDRTCIHYVGYDDSWDECVTADRIKE